MTKHFVGSRMDRIRTVMFVAILPFVLAGCWQRNGPPTQESSTNTAPQSCKEFQKDRNSDPDFSPERPVRVPPALQPFVKASDTTLTISTFGKAPVCVDISTADVRDLEVFAEGRLVGFALTGYEWDAYSIVDRAKPGSQIEIGDRPTFSPNGKRFAAVQTSGDGGGLQGMGAWEVTKTAVQPLFFLSGGLMGYGAKLERWVGNDCFIVSWLDNTAEAHGFTYRVELKRGVAVRGDSDKCADEAERTISDPTEGTGGNSV